MYRAKAGLVPWTIWNHTPLLFHMGHHLYPIPITNGLWINLFIWTVHFKSNTNFGNRMVQILWFTFWCLQKVKHPKSLWCLYLEPNQDATTKKSSTWFRLQIPHFWQAIIVCGPPHVRWRLQDQDFVYYCRITCIFFFFLLFFKLKIRNRKQKVGV